MEPVPIIEFVLLFTLFLEGGPDIDCREALDIVGFIAGGPIEGRLLVLRRDLPLESEVLAVAVVGVVVRGVDAAELADDASSLVGDFVGDYAIQLEIVSTNELVHSVRAMTIVTQDLTQFR